ncbi:hypothetical protein PGB28_16855 [Primorskyibacter aestuariivivens]|uniref:hypothetical protein n=1 Tax=Primorskyibacter aestuariivivens TaxID=1888912 RepID=UPI002300C109|nr:hypothetical protein [Primorskyibacter aestuariivivens]MDA7430134.1 hypothetical protein [Primorskyibacter aestuariivivens]
MNTTTHAYSADLERKRVARQLERFALYGLIGAMVLAPVAALGGYAVYELLGSETLSLAFLTGPLN